MNTQQRFWSKVEKTDSCWNWLGSKVDGYGKFWLNGKTIRVHRLSYEMIKGKIPNGLQIDHLCRNRRCVNPDHLETVTSQENTLRGDTIIRKNKEKTHCPQGHEYTKENTIIDKDKNGRECRICHNKAWLKWRDKHYEQKQAYDKYYWKEVKSKKEVQE